jgi:hypothetical protein
MGAGSRLGLTRLIHFRRAGLRRWLAIVAFTVGAASTAQAGILDGHPAAFDGVAGSVPFNNGVGLSGIIDYAVFAANDFNANFGGLGYVPGDVLVYAYQVLVSGSLGVSAEIIGISNPANTIGTFKIGDVDALSASFTPDARWLFSPEIPTGTSTWGLAFSSPRLPIVGASLTLDGGTQALVAGVPTPGPLNVPEPTSLLLVASGLLACGVTRAGRRRVAAVCAAMTLASGASAGSLATTNFALNDGFGPDAGRWHGTVSIAGAAFGDTVVAEVDWAAFAHGDFQLYLNGEGIAQADPSAPGEIVYVYAITSVTTVSPGIDTLTVGVDAADGRGVVSAPSFVPTGAATERAPTSGGDNTTSMAWFFAGSELQVGDTSSLLVFSAPFHPEYDFLQINSGLAGPVVSPLVASISDRRVVPEPSTAVLWLIGSFGLLARRRKAR